MRKFLTLKMLLIVFSVVFLFGYYGLLLSPVQAGGCDSSTTGSQDPVCDRVPTEWAAPNPDKSIIIDAVAFDYIADSYRMLPIISCKTQFNDCLLSFNILDKTGAAIGTSPDWPVLFVLDKKAKSGVWHIFDQSTYKEVTKWLVENDPYQ